ncbi:hypothetical protein [Halobacteriovorax marinus]|uniref:hypothetical protein n=1 Tax=Halobacteriovorax marinus TaxID=97084 RepID=UPI003A92122C
MTDQKRIYLLSFFVFILTSLLSIGFLHPDEQYYTLDFAFYKLGILDQLQTWELETKIRPWTLPYLYVALLAPFKFLGLENPFALATIARLFSACLGFFTLFKFIQIYKEKLPKVQSTLFEIFALFFWPIVFMSSRTSSDNISTCVLLLGFLTIQKEISKKSLLQGGLLLGLAFSLRHQTGILSLAFGLWILIREKMCPITWLKYFASSITIGVLIGLGFDFLGYSHFTLTPINYLTENLIKDKISSFGVSPWWGYFSLTLKKLNIFGLLFIASSLVFIKKFPKSLEATLFIAFFIFHSMIGHKELRFIYPLLWISLYMCFRIINFKNYKRVFIFLFSINLIGVAIVSFKPAYTPLKFYKFLYHFKEGSPLTVHIFKDRKGRYPELEMKVYKRKQLTLTKDQIPTAGSFYTFTTKYSDLEQLRRSFNCELKYLSYPEWVLEYNFFKWRDRSNIWALNYCSQ